LPPIVTVTVSIDCLGAKVWTGVNVAVPVAVDVPPVSPELKVTLGAVVYPEPALVIVTDTTARFVSLAVAAALVVGVPPPVKVTVGALVYRPLAVGLVTVTADT
jgi:hypothetical protein